MPINPSLTSTIRVGELSPSLPTLSSIIPHELGEQLYSMTMQNLIDLLNLNVGVFQYEVKTLYVDQAYIDNNFDNTGLGINLCVGFAIINGNNGTPPASGMFELSYKAGVYPIGGYGGEKDHELILNELPSITINLPGQKGGDNNDNNNTTRFAGGDKAQNETSFNFDLPFTINGGGAKHNNMPPYFVCLKIMKL